MKRAEAAKRGEAAREHMQLLITLGAPDSDVICVESVDKSGRKHEMSTGDFATLVHDDDVVDLLPVLEEAYMAGFADASSDVFEPDDAGQHGESEGALEQAVIRGVASQRLIRRGVRRLILARLLKRELMRKRGAAPTVAASETSH